MSGNETLTYTGGEWRRTAAPPRVPSVWHVLAMVFGIHTLVFAVCAVIASGEFGWMQTLVQIPLGSAMVGWAAMTRP